MPDWRTISTWTIILVPILWAFYDLIAYWRSGNEATISRVMLETSRRYTLFALVIVFIFGLLCGHLFVPQHIVEGTSWLLRTCLNSA